MREHRPSSADRQGAGSSQEDLDAHEGLGPALQPTPDAAAWQFHDGRIGFHGLRELESQAKGAIKKKQRQHVALSRFGTVEALFSDTPAEAACKKALRGVRRSKDALYNDYDDAQAAARFAKKPDLQPFTLADCMHGQAYWDALYELRSPFDDAGDGPAYAYAHDDYCFDLMAKLAPRSKDEALAVFDFMKEHDDDKRAGAPAIVRNLIAGGWA